MADENLADYFGDVLPHLNERQRRVAAGAMARALGYGGVKAVAVASGLSLSTVQGSREVGEGVEPSERVRARGAGRKRAEEAQPGLADALDGLVEPETRGDPGCPLRWTTKSLRNLSEDLASQGYAASPPIVGQMLAATGYSFAGAGEDQGGSGPPRPGRPIPLHRGPGGGFPVLRRACDQRRCEEEGAGGRLFAGRPGVAPGGQSSGDNTYDFPDKELGKAVPYGVYDLAENAGWVSVGRSADTAEFAAQTIRCWWHRMGKSAYPNATRLLITADGGGRTDTASSCGRRRSLTSLGRSAWTSPSSISRAEHPNGTR